VLGGDALERVQVHADEVERLDALLAERLDVVRTVAPGEDAGVNAGMQRLDPAAEQLRHLGQLLHARNVQAHLLERRGGAAARDEIPAQVGESSGELDEARLVVHGQEGAH
jgi:hypothetical protein